MWAWRMEDPYKSNRHIKYSRDLVKNPGFDFKEVKNGMTKYYKTVSEILNEVTSIDALSEAQKDGIRQLCNMAQVKHREQLKSVLNKAYEAGRKYDMAEHVSIAMAIENGEYNLTEIE